MITEASKDIDQIRKDLAALRGDVTSLTASIRHLAAAGGRDTMDRIEELTDRAKDKAGEALRSSERTLGEHPFASVATGFGLGIVLGVLLDRKR
jgi:ElaB/YqjD/DUF883 family membrane-anchored ribosome-binding protein